MKAVAIPYSSALSELSRFTNEEQSEECAFSGQIDFSRIGKGKNTKNFFCGRKKYEN